MEISIVIPAYNEEKRISNTLKTIDEYLSTKFKNYEILVIDDGSKDNTIQRIEDMNIANVRILQNKRNQGKGYAVRKGVLNAKGSIILFSDADLSTPIEEFEKLHMQLKNGYNITIGSRRLKNSDIKIKQPLYRRILGKGFGITVRLLMGMNIKDTQCGFKLFKKDIAKQLFNIQRIKGFSFDVEILFLARKNKARIKEIPVIWKDSAAESKVNAFSESFRMLRDLIKIRMMHR